MAKTNQTSAAAAKSPVAETTGPLPDWIAVDNLEQLLRDIDEQLDTMSRYMQAGALTHAERRRLQGSGVRRYGFIDKVSDVAADNMQFAPQYFDIDTLKDYLRMIEVLRNISLSLQQMQRISDDVLLQVSDEAYQLALGYYNTVREAARRRQTGAQEVFSLLQAFFRRGSRPGSEPTEHEVERDVRALLHGRKDGKIIVENERPHTTGGKHVLVDETHKARAAWKETEEGEIGG